MIVQDISQPEIGKHLVAFLNSGNGGRILIGAIPKTGELVGVKDMDRKSRDMFRQGFDEYLDGRLIKPKILIDLVSLNFYELADKDSGGSTAKRHSIHLIDVVISKTAGRDTSDYRFTQGMYKNVVFFRRGGKSVEMTAESMRKTAIEEASAKAE
jgi:hypothetical protein